MSAPGWSAEGTRDAAAQFVRALSMSC